MISARENVDLLVSAGNEGMTRINHPLWFPLRESPNSSFPKPGLGHSVLSTGKLPFSLLSNTCPMSLPYPFLHAGMPSGSLSDLVKLRGSPDSIDFPYLVAWIGDLLATPCFPPFLFPGHLTLQGSCESDAQSRDKMTCLIIVYSILCF